MPCVEGCDLKIIKDGLMVYFQREKVGDFAIVEGFVYVACLAGGLL
jgi:hypothetical protein